MLIAWINKPEGPRLWHTSTAMEPTNGTKIAIYQSSSGS